jgi:hypothetical protein
MRPQLLNRLRHQLLDPHVRLVAIVCLGIIATYLGLHDGAPVEPSLSSLHLTDEDVSVPVHVTSSELWMEQTKLVHPLASESVAAISFVRNEEAAQSVVTYRVAPTPAVTPLNLFSPVTGRVVWLDGLPGHSYSIDILPEGADYFVWLYISLGEGGEPGLRLPAPCSRGCGSPEGCCSPNAMRASQTSA